MKFNIILFHIGLYDERKSDYLKIFSECFNSVLNEFYQDNIIIFHSFEEIFKQFPQIEDQIKTKYAEFWETTTDFRYKTDLIRVLLTQIYENMIYIDADIYIFKGFRESLINQINLEVNKDKLLYILPIQNLSIFYCKHFFPELNLFLNTFTEDYRGDEALIVLRGFEMVKDTPFFRMRHFGSIKMIEKFWLNDSTKIFIINSPYSAHAENPDFWLKLENVFVIFLDKTVVYYKNQSRYTFRLIDTPITIDDVLEAIGGSKDLKKQEIKIKQLLGYN